MSVVLTGQLYEGHAPRDAPNPADYQQERRQLQQPCDDVQQESIELAVKTRRRTATEHAECSHRCSCHATSHT